MEYLIEQVTSEFASRFKSTAKTIISPGRVNLIGEHTDYNNGFVLPAAIHKVIVLAMAPNGGQKVRVFSLDMGEYAEIDLSGELAEQDKHWAKYVKGVIAELRKDGFDPEGVDIVFGGDIPIGAGLSSSAALEGGLLLGFKTLFGFELSKKQMAQIGQRTEHNHVGVRCGIMDQFINIHGEEGNVLKLDCRSLEYELVPFRIENMKVVLCNSKVSHNLASSEYNVRRAQCEEGVSTLKQYHPEVESLRDVSLQMLEEHKKELSEVVYRRCRFVVEENERVVEGAKDLAKGDVEAFGQKMFRSHRGLSEMYEVSCRELDVLVDIAKDLPGLYGSRMMGGGFGGCTINLVNEAHLPGFINVVTSEYNKRTGMDTEIYVTEVGGGVRVA